MILYDLKGDIVTAVYNCMPRSLVYRRKKYQSSAFSSFPAPAVIM